MTTSSARQVGARRRSAPQHRVPVGQSPASGTHARTQRSIATSPRLPSKQIGAPAPQSALQSHDSPGPLDPSATQSRIGSWQLAVSVVRWVHERTPHSSSSSHGVLHAPRLHTRPAWHSALHPHDSPSAPGASPSATHSAQKVAKPGPASQPKPSGHELGSASRQSATRQVPSTHEAKPAAPGSQSASHKQTSPTGTTPGVSLAQRAQNGAPPDDAPSVHS